MIKIIIPTLSFNIEKWKYNKQYDIYVSNYGRFRSRDKTFIPIKIGKKTGYAQVEIKENFFKAAHRLVLETWQPIQGMEDLTVNHIDHNRRNNKLSNLEWMTEEENQKLAEEDLYEEMNVANFNQIMKQNLGKPIIICGNKIFNSYDEIITFLIESKKINNIQNKTTIKHNIIKAIKQQKKYCNFLFELR